MNVILRQAFIVAAVAVGLLLGYLAFGVLNANAASCHHTLSAFGAPDNACTPGAGTILPRAQVCSSKDRPSLSAADRRKILRQYGVPGWTGAQGEIDHRWPFFLGGFTTEDNLWPEPGPIPNPKDALENLVRKRICGSVTGYVPSRATMRVRTGVRIFLDDWRNGYCRFVSSLPKICAGRV